MGEALATHGRWRGGADVLRQRRAAPADAPHTCRAGRALTSVCDARASARVRGHPRGRPCCRLRCDRRVPAALLQRYL